MLRLLADENFNGDIVRALLLRQPDLDIVRVQDVGLAGVGDSAILAWAAANDRIILTHDRATLPDYAFERLAIGESMPGVFILNDRFPAQDLDSESPRSGRQHKAWGVSPRIESGKAIKAREAGGSRIIWTNVKRSGYHPLRGFNQHFWYVTWGSRPRLYADVRSADSKQVDASSILLPL